MLFDDIWGLLKPEMVDDAADDALELSPKSDNASKPPDFDDGCGDNNDWTASSASEAAPTAGNMAQTPNGQA